MYQHLCKSLFSIALVCSIISCVVSVREEGDEYNEAVAKAPVEEQVTPHSDVLNNDYLMIRANKIMEYMTLDEKIGQLIIARVPVNANDYTTDIPPNIKNLIEQVHPGGLIFFSKTIANTHQIQQLLGNIQQHSDIPLFISVDIEGGAVNRFANTDNPILSSLPSPKKVGNSYSVQETREYSEKIARELQRIGFNMNFAPVVDIKYPYTASFLEERIFTKEAKLTTQYSIAFMEGHQEQGVISVFKHFPGHGGAEGDTHFESTQVNVGYADLYNNDLLPYRYAIPNGLIAIMLGHLLVPVLDYEYISPISVKTINYLEYELGFRGLIITDSLIMNAAKMSQGRIFEVEAINAGVDILLDPHNPKKTLEQIKRAVENGDIPIETINQSLRKILGYKLYMEII